MKLLNFSRKLSIALAIERKQQTSGFRVAGIWPLDTIKFDEQLVDATSSLENSSGSLQRILTSDAQIASTSNVQEAMAPDAQIPSTSNVHRAVLDKSIPLEDIVNNPKLPQPKTKQALFFWKLQL
ncbi:hypothetical protein QE152_g22810 [Popillia japonica]|uniref:Uncharacterized protein n=1 Tax=Popillia japonica TaxID=7064 RepID=A0AAW1KJD8_POPJA